MSIFRLITIISVIVLSLAACLPSDDEAASQAEPTVLITQPENPNPSNAEEKQYTYVLVHGATFYLG
jgi:hypothetical protein